jgi:hypothetical protein
MGLLALALVGFLFLQVLMLSPAAAGTASERSGPVILRRGITNAQRWSIWVSGDGHRRGICLVAAVFNGSPPQGGKESGECSAPALRRGFVNIVARRYRNGAPKVTVVGAAFNRGVKRVEVIRPEGEREQLALETVRNPPSDQPQVGHFRYAAFALPKAWCVRELITRGDDGARLWTVSGADLLPYDSQRYCSNKP